MPSSRRADRSTCSMGCTGGRSRESEVWRDLDALQQDVHSGHGFSAVHLAIKPGSETSLVAALESDLRLLLDALSELRFYAQQSPADQLRGFGLVPAGILGVGAVFGGMNTMYSAVDVALARSVCCVRSASGACRSSRPSCSRASCWPARRTTAGMARRKSR